MRSEERTGDRRNCLGTFIAVGLPKMFLLNFIEVSVQSGLEIIKKKDPSLQVA